MSDYLNNYLKEAILDIHIRDYTEEEAAPLVRYAEKTADFFAPVAKHGSFTRWPIMDWKTFRDTILDPDFSGAFKYNARFGVVNAGLMSVHSNMGQAKFAGAVVNLIDRARKWHEYKTDKNNCLAPGQEEEVARLLNDNRGYLAPLGLGGFTFQRVADKKKVCLTLARLQHEGIVKRFSDRGFPVNYCPDIVAYRKELSGVYTVALIEVKGVYGGGARR